jgi:hypothetical protein
MEIIEVMPALDIHEVLTATPIGPPTQEEAGQGK